jgi:hypothetical protein
LIGWNYWTEDHFGLSYRRAIEMAQMMAGLLVEMKAEIRTNQERMEAKMEIYKEKVEIPRSKMWTSQEVMLESCLEKTEANPEVEAVTENHEVCNEETTVEMIVATEDQTRDHDIPAWCKGCSRKGLRHKTAATSEGGEDIRQDLEESHRTGDQKVNSWVFDWALWKVTEHHGGISPPSK